MQAHYSRLFANPDGTSCFESLETELKLGFGAPPAEPLYAAQFMPAVEAFWMGASPAWKGDTP